MALFNLVLHHIRAHKTTGLRTGCAVCVRLEGPNPMIKPEQLARLRLRHYVEHELGIVTDGPGLGLRFADMPKRRYAPGQVSFRGGR